MKKTINDEEMEAEIERLRSSPLVKLAQAEQQLRYRRRQTLYRYRTMENRGRKLADAGITLGMLRSMESFDELSELYSQDDEDW